MMQCMYERGRGADRLSTQHRESGAKGLDFSLSFVTDVPAEGIVSLNITFFVFQVRTTLHHTYSCEDMT